MCICTLESLLNYIEIYPYANHYKCQPINCKTPHFAGRTSRNTVVIFLNIPSAMIPYITSSLYQLLFIRETVPARKLSPRERARS